MGCVSLCLAECLLRRASRRLSATSRSDIMHRWSTRILSVMRVQVRVAGPVPLRGLIVSNHLSYLDILVLSAVTRCLFVSKREVKWWPMVGWVAAMTGTVFVDRSRRSQTHRVRTEMQDRLHAGERLVLFPEATSSNGRQLLPFYSSLFESAVADAVPATATYLSYELAPGEGDPVMDVCYWGDMTLLPHVIKLLTKTKVQAYVAFADKPRTFSHRKQAALEMQRQIQELSNSSGTLREFPGNTAKSGADQNHLAANPRQAGTGLRK